jgi:hypothetical protein
MMLIILLFFYVLKRFTIDEEKLANLSKERKAAESCLLSVKPVPREPFHR